MPSAEPSRLSLAPPGIALGLAASAAVLLQLAARAPESVAELLWLLGWALAVWSAILAVVAVVALVMGHRLGALRASGDVSPPSAILPGLMLVVAAVALLSLTFWLHPFVGAGSGIG